MRSLAAVRDVQEIRRRLAALTEADQRLWGVMSTGQMLCHVRDTFAMALGERSVAPVRTPIPPRMMKWIGLSSPMRWPQNLPTAPELRQFAGADVSVGFDAAWQEMREKFECLASARDLRRVILSLAGCLRRTGCGGGIFTRTTTCSSLDAEVAHG